MFPASSEGEGPLTRSSHISLQTAGSIEGGIRAIIRYQYRKRRRLLYLPLYRWRAPGCGRRGPLRLLRAMRRCILQCRGAPGAVECWAGANEDTLRPQRAPRRLVLSQRIRGVDWCTAGRARVERERAMLSTTKLAVRDSSKGDDSVQRRQSVWYS